MKQNINLKSVLIVSICSIAYLVLSAIFIGYKPDQLLLVILFNSLFHLNLKTRNFILGFLIFIVFWIVFDSMKAFPNYKFNKIHVKELYSAEKSLFGVSDGGNIVTPNEFCEIHSNTFLDVLSGIFYINWVPIPLIFAFYLFQKRRILFLQFALSFLFVNLIGFAIYYLYPAAPPWYVKYYGFDVIFNTPGNTAGLSRFDSYFNISLFQSLYSKSSNVFAAMPSLHCSYPVIVLYFGIKNRMGLINLFFAFFMLGIWFSAVYSGHHYILDVLGGVICALSGLLLFDKILLELPLFRKFITNYNSLISKNNNESN